MGILNRILNGVSSSRRGRPTGRRGGTGGGLGGILRRAASNPQNRRKAQQSFTNFRNRSRR